MDGQALELVLAHDGRAWVAHGAGLRVRGADLATLDVALAGALAGAHRSAHTLTVHMRFDLDALPAWTRQYAGHYFNRTVRLTLPGAEAPG